MNKVLITAPCHPVLKERLLSAGYSVMDLPTISQVEFEACIGDIHGLILSTRIKVTAQVLQAAVRLKWIGRLGSGLELIDLEAAKDLGINVQSSPEGNRDSVGEHALGILLGLMHNITRSYLQIKDWHWIRDANRGIELSGKTVGIIGFGNTGQAFARVLKGFKVTILAHDKYLRGFGDSEVSEVSLNELLQESDVVSLHLPLNEETIHFANKVFFNQLKKKPFFLNISRGKIHETRALIDALEKGIISGAGLDVLENEVLSSYTENEKSDLSFLLTDPRVIITPHIAGYSVESFYKMSQILANKLGI
jgi:D-3-phosphoglycerate dehydrogenase